MMGLIKQHEGFKTAAYADGTDNDGNQLYSIGYGNQTIRDQLSGNWRSVRKEDVIGSEDEALNASKGWINEKILPVLNKAIGNHKIDPAMHDVMVSLSYNIKGGAEAVVQSQFFAKVLAGNLWGNSDDPKGAMEEFEEFKHTTTKLKDGTVLKEVNEVLARRRNDEIRYLMDNSPYTLQAYQAMQENMQLESYSNVEGVVNVVNADVNTKDVLKSRAVESHSKKLEELDKIGFFTKVGWAFTHSSNDVGYLTDVLQLWTDDAYTIHEGRLMSMSQKHGKKWLTADYDERMAMENAAMAKEAADDNAILQWAKESGEYGFGMWLGEFLKAGASPTSLIPLGVGAKAVGAGAKIFSKTGLRFAAGGGAFGGEFELLRQAATEQEFQLGQLGVSIATGAILTPAIAIGAPKAIGLTANAVSKKVNVAVARKASSPEAAAKQAWKLEHELYNKVDAGRDELGEYAWKNLTKKAQETQIAGEGKEAYIRQARNGHPFLEGNEKEIYKAGSKKAFGDSYQQMNVDLKDKAIKEMRQEFPQLWVVGERSKNGTNIGSALTPDAKNKVAYWDSLSPEEQVKLAKADPKQRGSDIIPGLPALMGEDIVKSTQIKDFGVQIAFKPEKMVGKYLSVAKTRLNNIHPMLGKAITKIELMMSEMEHASDLAFDPFLKVIRPYHKFWSGKLKGDDASIKFNEDLFFERIPEVRKALVAKHGEKAGGGAIDNLMKRLKEMQKEGVESGWLNPDQVRENHIPRMVKDYKGHQEYFMKANAEMAAQNGKKPPKIADDSLALALENGRATARKEGKLFNEEDALMTWMKDNYYDKKQWATDTGSSKERVVPDGLLRHPKFSGLREFYHDPETAIRNYMIEYAEQVSVRKAFPMYTVTEKGDWFKNLTPERQAAELLKETGKKMPPDASLTSGTKKQQEKALKKYKKKVEGAYEKHLYEKLGIKKLADDETTLNLGGEAGGIDRGNLTGPFGHFLYGLGIRDQNRVDEAQHILGIMYQSGNIEPNVWLRKARSAGYAMTIGNISSALTQAGDLGVSMWVNGLFNTLGTVASRVGRTTRGKAHKAKFVDVTRDFNMGKMGHEMATDWAGQVKTRGLAKAISLNNILKVSQFSRLDRFGKNVFAESAMKKAYNDVIKNGGKGIRAKYGRILDDAEMSNLFKEIGEHKKTGVMGDQLRYHVFTELLDVQPLAKSSVPVGYLQHPNGRIAYQLKTWTIKQLDLIRNTAGEKYKRGDYVGGTKDFITLALVMGSMNTSMDIIKEFVNGKDFDVEDDLLDTMTDNLMSQLGLGGRFGDTAVKDGVFDAVIDLVKPASIDKLQQVGGNLASLVVTQQGEEAVQNNVADLVGVMPVLGHTAKMRLLDGAERSDKYRDRKEKEWVWFRGL
jgi:GH24 family phage-related lysozyme (muramidase)